MRATTEKEYCVGVLNSTCVLKKTVFRLGKSKLYQKQIRAIRAKFILFISEIPHHDSLKKSPFWEFYALELY